MSLRRIANGLALATFALGTPELKIEAQTPWGSQPTSWDVMLFDKEKWHNSLLFWSTESEKAAEELAKKILSCSKESCSIQKKECSQHMSGGLNIPCPNTYSLVEGNDMDKVIATVGLDGLGLDAILQVASKIKKPMLDLYCRCPKPGASPTSGSIDFYSCDKQEFELVAKSLSTKCGPSAIKKKTPFLSLASQAASDAPELDIRAETPTKTPQTSWDIALYDTAKSRNPILYTSTDSEAETDALAKKILSCTKDSCSIIKEKCDHSPLPWITCSNTHFLVHGSETLATVGVDRWQLDAILEVTSKIRMPTLQLYCTCPKSHDDSGLIHFYSCDRQEFDFVAKSLSTKCGPSVPNGAASDSVVMV